MAPFESPPRPAVHGHPPGRRRFVPHLRRRGDRSPGDLHDGLRPVCTRSFQGQQHRLPAQAAQRFGCRPCAGQAAPPHVGRAQRLRFAGPHAGRQPPRGGFPGARARQNHPAAPQQDRLLLHVEREGHGLRFRRRGLPAGQNPRSVAGTASRVRILPGQPPVHRRAAGREGDRRVVREPSHAAPHCRNARADCHFQSPRSRIQGVAAVASPCRIGG